MSAESLSTLILLGSFFLMILLRFPIAYSVGMIIFELEQVFQHIEAFFVKDEQKEAA